MDQMNLADHYGEIKRREHYQGIALLAAISALVIAARQACLDRGLTSGGMWIGVDLAAKPDETAYFIAGQKDVAGEL